MKVTLYLILKKNQPIIQFYMKTLQTEFIKNNNARKKFPNQYSAPRGRPRYQLNMHSEYN